MHATPQGRPGSIFSLFVKFRSIFTVFTCQESGLVFWNTSDKAQVRNRALLNVIVSSTGCEAQVIAHGMRVAPVFPNKMFCSGAGNMKIICCYHDQFCHNMFVAMGIISISRTAESLHVSKIRPTSLNSRILLSCSFLNISANIELKK